MTARFDKIIIIGLGLIGGSLAGALKPAAPFIYGVDPNAEAVNAALERGLIDEAANVGGVRALLADGDIDLVVLATPAGAFGEWFSLIAESGYAGVVTDVGSTKEEAVRCAKGTLICPERYVPGHPMAGSDESGIGGARSDLFSGAYWILTPDNATDIYAFRRVHELLTSIGARVISVSPEEHDRVVAIVSHVPHIAAAALVTLAGNHAGENGEMLRLAAGGFKDTTRIASGSPALWTGILLDNAKVVADELVEYGQIVAAFERLVRAGDADGISALLTEAVRVRGRLPSKWTPQSENLIEVRIPMNDRKGIIAEITTAAGRAECNIEAIDIDHQTEDRAILELVLTDEGDVDGFIASLERGGLSPRRRGL